MASADRPADNPRTQLFLLFFFSGISGLIYESLWSRYIRQFVGSAATAQILVLALFMGGMSLGALLAARLLPRVRSPIRAYAIIEGIVGLYALAFPFLQSVAVRLAYDVLFPAVGSGAGIAWVKWSVAAVLVLPPCVLLGMTFPLMSVGILRRDLQRSGEILSALYFCNSLGASVGAIVSGFLLVPTIGLPATLACGAAINLGIMAVALTDRDHGGTAAITSVPDQSRTAFLTATLFLCVALGTGLSSFMYEIGWIRLLSMVLGSATHSFEVMLSAFIFGMACGGLWVRKRMDKYQHPELVLAIVQLVMGVSAIATLPAYRAAIQGMALITVAEERTWLLWILFNIVRYLLCLLIMFPATFCAGMTLPLLTHVLLRRGHSEQVVGRIYGINTLGAIAGAVLAGLVLMPLIGLRLVIVGGAMIDMVLALALLGFALREEVRPPGLKLLTSVTLATACTAAVVGIFVIRVDPMSLTSTVFRHGRTRLPDDYKLLRYVDGRTASVTTIERTDKPGYRVIYTNGKPDASVQLIRWPEGRKLEEGPVIAGDEPNQFLVGIIPFLFRPDAQQVAIIGFGSGVSVHTLLGSPNITRLDTIEIEPEMVESAKIFQPENIRAYEDPRSHIWFDDAKAYFASAGGSYDFIVSEPTNPWVSGVASLFTVEFYRETKRYLKPNGMLCQWIQGYELSDELFLSVLAAVDQEFVDFIVLRVGYRDWIIMAVADGKIGPISDALLRWDDMQYPLGLLGIRDLAQLQTLTMANKKLLHPHLATLRPNTDAFPRLDTGAEHARFMREQADVLHELRNSPFPVLPVLAGVTMLRYPSSGIGDLRDPHVLEEAERAVYLLRAYKETSLTVPGDMDVSSMRDFLGAQGAANQGQAAWYDWVRAVFAVYDKTVPYIDVIGSEWWQSVVRTAQQPSVPKEVVASISLLDALGKRDADVIATRSAELLARPDAPLGRNFLAVAGGIALELKGADQGERKAYVERYFANPQRGLSDSEQRAFIVLRDYLLRSE